MPFCSTYCQTDSSTQDHGKRHNQSLNKRNDEIKGLTTYILHLEKELQKLQKQSVMQPKVNQDTINKMYERSAFLSDLDKNNNKQNNVQSEVYKYNDGNKQTILHNCNAKSKQIQFEDYFIFSLLMKLDELQQKLKVSQAQNALLKMSIKQLDKQGNQLAYSYRVNDLSMNVFKQQSKQIYELYLNIQMTKLKEISLNKYNQILNLTAKLQQISSLHPSKSSLINSYLISIYQEMITQLSSRSHQPEYQTIIAHFYSQIIKMSIDMPQLIGLEAIHRYTSLLMNLYNQNQSYYFQEKIVLLNNLTLFKQKQQKSTQQCEQIYRQMIELQQKYFSKSDQRHLITKNNLACFYAQKCNNIRKATQLFEECLNKIDHQLNFELYQLIVNNYEIYCNGLSNKQQQVQHNI